MKKFLSFAAISAILIGSFYIIFANKITPINSKNNNRNNFVINQASSLQASLLTTTNQSNPIPNTDFTNNGPTNRDIGQNLGDNTTASTTTNLQDAPSNTWVKIAESPTGRRDWPLFYFDSINNKFMLHGGEPKGKSHFDVEQFDLSSSKWINAYPSGAPYKTESGPTDAPNTGFGDNEPGLKADKNGVTRILRGLNPYIRDPGMFFQGTFCPDSGKAYAYFQNGTICYDTKTLQWSDLKIPKFSKGNDTWLIYGSVAYDAINKELISVGGTSDEDGGSPGTWLFNIAEGKWKKLSSGSSSLKELNTAAKNNRIKLAAYLNACRNRFYLTENDAEAKVNLASSLNELVQMFEKFSAQLKSTNLNGSEMNASKFAMTENTFLSTGLKTLSGKFSEKITSEHLMELQTLLDNAERVEHALDTEPCGRAASPMAASSANGKIVLFSGSRMDGYIADTWVYDCKTRVWEQRFPKTCPPPRAGHTLAWLPKSKKVILYGAIPFTSPYTVPHQTPPPPSEVWVYDLDTNEWKLLVPQSAESPYSIVGAVDSNDTLIVLGFDNKFPEGRVTWALKADPSKPVSGTANSAVSSGFVANVFEHASAYDKVNKIDQENVSNLIKNLKANQWTIMPKPAKMSNSHPWGISPYDTTRHQLLSFGGGHSASHYTDVTHYSISSATWSWGYGEEYPYFNASFSAMFNQTFRNRPTVPTHVWGCATFDETTGKAMYCIRGGTWFYDPATREWEYPPVWGTECGMASLVGTPKGVVFWGRGDGRVSGELKLFNNTSKKWDILPMKGGVPIAYSDTGGICYDSKRDCLWLAHFGNPMLRYDMKTGEVVQDSANGQPENIYMRGIVYIPELDMLLNAGRVVDPEGVAGNLFYDIQNKKWIGVQFPCSDGKVRTNEKAYTDINLAVSYDPKLKIAIFHSNEMEIFISRFDKASLKTFEAKIVQKK